MKKVSIIGSSGAGKSTFARRLGAITGLEVIHLDKVYWQPNWIEPDKAEWRKTVAEIVKGDSWITDGNYGGTLEIRFQASDTIIFLDVPRVLCVYRVLKRVASYRKSTRPDMGEGCEERLDWEFIKWIWDFPNRSRPNIESLINRFQAGKTVICLKSAREVERFLANYSKTAVLE